MLGGIFEKWNHIFRVCFNISEKKKLFQDDMTIEKTCREWCAFLSFLLAKHLGVGDGEKLITNQITHQAVIT